MNECNPNIVVNYQNKYIKELEAYEEFKNYNKVAQKNYKTVVLDDTTYHLGDTTNFLTSKSRFFVSVVLCLQKARKESKK